MESKKFDKSMWEKIDKLIRGKNVNFLIGAGASIGFHGALSFKDEKDNNFIFPTFEDVVRNKKIDDKVKKILYLYYFWKCIEPKFIDKKTHNRKYKETFNNYYNLVSVLYDYLLGESNERPKRINIFTTNYDLFFEKVFDKFLTNNPLLYFNDGSRGVFNRYVHNDNFYLNITHSGYNDNYRREVPTINLFKMHGSLSWELKNKKEEIIVKEKTKIIKKINSKVNRLEINHEDIKFIINQTKEKIKLNSNQLKNNSKNSKRKKCEIKPENFIQTLKEYIDGSKRLKNIDKNERELDNFYKEYEKLLIINPDKRKFSQTVLQQHYYQLLRSFSYELERKQSILIVFGFSFADEHLRDIFKRSLLNPELHVIMITYDKVEQKRIKNMFSKYKNITYLPENKSVSKKEKGDFNYLLNLLGYKNGK